MLSPYPKKRKKKSFARNINSSNEILEVLRAFTKCRVLNCRKNNNNFSFISPFFLKKIKLLFNFKAWDDAKHWCPFILLNFLLCSVFFQCRLCQQISVVLILSCRKGNPFFSLFCVIFWRFHFLSTASIFNVLNQYERRDVNILNTAGWVQDDKEAIRVCSAWWTENNDYSYKR